MSSKTDSSSADKAVDEIYEDYEHWELNTGDETIHAKRIGGFWRNIKWLTASVWLLFFLGYFVRWGDRQAVFFDIGNRQFHIFNFTILPQDFWMLSLLLLFFALLLAASTALFGRVYCGFFCFQTIWTDVYTWIEDKLEGAPPKRRKLEKAPLDFAKFRVKFVKHLLWLIIGFVTGVSFVAWFYDGIQLWKDIFTFQVGSTATITIALFTAGTYVLAGFLREQTCFWLCPYARIQSVMIDTTSAVVTYDFHRGEPRGRVKKGQPEAERTTGDCVDCKQCIAVCPTGVDIRHGSQEGCINCALCIDACDTVMEKLNRPTGLIRYESLDEIDGKEARPLLKRPRVWIYSGIMSLALVGIAFGLSTIDAVELKVLHDRQPLFVMQSDGSIQNKYMLKILNKMDKDVSVNITATGPEGLKIVGADEPVEAEHGKINSHTVFVRVPDENLKAETEPIVFHIETVDSGEEKFSSDRESVFIGPRR
ncbi:MAG: cytochrome c oxidase accessory protein CcoG [Pseudomonadota bacterium]